jgi:DNA-binding response OmpR family regulator
VPRILVVEDDHDIATLLANDLRLDGYDVEIASDGHAAVRRARERLKSTSASAACMAAVRICGVCSSV